MVTIKEMYDDLIRVDAYWRSNPGKRPNVQGPVYQWLSSVRAKKILDAGCGRGDLGSFLQHFGLKVRGCDIAEAKEYCPFPFDQADLTALPYEDDSFDAVACVDVIEHLSPEDVNRAISEMLRVARHVVIHAACYESHHAQYRELHLTIQSPEWWMKKFWEHGNIIKSHKITRMNRRKNKLRETFCALIERRDEDSIQPQK